MLDAVQLPLFPGEDFNPLGTDPRHYLTALLKRPGELLALRDVSPDVWPRLTPLIRIVGPSSRRPRPTQAATVRGWMKDIAQAIGRQPCYLHLVRSRADAPVLRSGAEQALLDCIHESARAEGIRFAPVLPLPARVDHFKIVQHTVLYDGHGAALLHSILDSVPVRSLRELFLDATEKLELEARSVDLLLDLGWITPEVEIDADDLARLVEQVSAIADWRNLALLGTSIPTTMQAVAEGTIGSLPRREWTLWKGLQRRAPGRLPIFGDYGVQNPTPPLDAGKKAGGRTCGLTSGTQWTTAPLLLAELAPSSKLAMISTANYANSSSCFLNSPAALSAKGIESFEIARTASPSLDHRLCGVALARPIT